MNTSKRLYTTGEIAELCHVTINAVKKWIAAGKIGAFRTPGGHFRINSDEFMAFLDKYKLEIKEESFPERRRILVVDDEPGIVEFIKGALEMMERNFLIETASDGYDALIKVGDFKPELLVLDIKMPKIDGLEVCRRLKSDEATKNIKILVVTAYGQTEIASAVLKSGADVCLSKPLNLKALQTNVDELLGKKRLSV